MYHHSFPSYWINQHGPCLLTKFVGYGNGIGNSGFSRHKKGGTMIKRLREDIASIFERDPAARSILEVLCCYPGLHAVWLHRASHWFWKHRLYFAGRLVSHFGRFLTGIEIHPGATIGRRVFIDHGMGVVIGETAEIGDDVTLYHGVTLGGVSLERTKRHPTIMDGVVIGSGSKVLGPFTVGKGSKIGSNSVVVKEVPPHSTVVGIPGRVVMSPEKPREKTDLEHGKLPDPEAKAIACLFEQLRELERKLSILSEEHAELQRRLERSDKEKPGKVRSLMG